jgi:phosphatidylglycerol:prolipoprotein diacylglycerol transferase
MHRILFTIPAIGSRIHSFSAMMLLACFGALGLTFWRARRERIDPASVSGLAVWLITGGFIGARVMFLAMHPDTVRHPGDVFKIWQGGIVFYGSILGGLIGSVIYWIRSPFPFRAMADAVAPALALGTALGRLGCFLNGCCYGAVSTLPPPLAVQFPVGSIPWMHQVERGWIPLTAGWSAPVHPTQLYAALDGLMLLALLSWYFPRRRRDGDVMALLMVTYSVLRFLNESLRGDEPAVLMGLTVAQAISAALFLAGLLTWLYLARMPRVRHVDTAPPLDDDPGGWMDARPVSPAISRNSLP